MRKLIELIDWKRTVLVLVWLLVLLPMIIWWCWHWLFVPWGLHDLAKSQALVMSCLGTLIFTRFF